MQEEVRARIQATFPDAEIHLEGQDCNLNAVIVSTAFEGQGLLARQRAVMATVQDLVSSGALHALGLKTYTPEQWQTQKDA